MHNSFTIHRVFKKVFFVKSKRCANKDMLHIPGIYTIVMHNSARSRGKIDLDSCHLYMKKAQSKNPFDGKKAHGMKTGTL